MIRRPPRSTLDRSSAASDVYKRQVLERALDDFEGTVLVISHDRYFLDQTVDRIVELDPDQGALVNYTGGYTAVSYTHLRAHETVLDIVFRLLLEKKKQPYTTVSAYFNSLNNTYIPNNRLS